MKIDRRIGDITRIRTGKLDANAQRAGGAYPFFTCGEEILEIDHYAFDTEAVLLAGNGNFNVKWYKGKFNAYQRTYVIEPQGVDGKWLFYAMQSALPTITKGNRGSTVRFIRIGDITDCLVSVPDISKQREIVAEIEKQFTRLDAGVTALKRVQANLKRYRASILKAACEGRLVPTEAELGRARSPKSRNIDGGLGKTALPADANYETGAQLLARILTARRQNYQDRGKYKDPAAPDTTNLPKLPEGWTWASVEQLTTVVQYGSSAKTNEDSNGVPVLRMGNIQDGSLIFDSLKYLPENHEEFPALYLEEGDMLFNRTNSAELVGKTAIYRGTSTPCSFASYLIRLRFVAGCTSDYVSYYINSSHGRAWINSVVSQQVGQANVNGTKLQALAIPLPPSNEQTRIVAEVERRLSIINELETLITTNLARANRLRQAILQQAFSRNLIETPGHLNNPSNSL